MIRKEFKFLNLITAIVISIICIVVTISIICIKRLNPSPITKPIMEDEFSKNKEILSSVAKYLEQQEYINVYITSNDKSGEMFTRKNNNEMGKDTQITDERIATSITDLFKKYNFEVITKDESGIYFQRWSNRKYGRGLVYSSNGERPENEQLTKLEPLSEGNWYFYEEE